MAEAKRRRPRKGAVSRTKYDIDKMAAARERSPITILGKQYLLKGSLDMSPAFYGHVNRSKEKVDAANEANDMDALFAELQESTRMVLYDNIPNEELEKMSIGDHMSVQESFGLASREEASTKESQQEDQA